MYMNLKLNRLLLQLFLRLAPMNKLMILFHLMQKQKLYHLIHRYMKLQ